MNYISLQTQILFSQYGSPEDYWDFYKSLHIFYYSNTLNLFPSPYLLPQAYLINHTFLYKIVAFYRYSLSNYLDILPYSKFIVTATTKNINNGNKNRLANDKYFVLY